MHHKIIYHHNAKGQWVSEGFIAFMFHLPFNSTFYSRLKAYSFIQAFNFSVKKGCVAHLFAWPSHQSFLETVKIFTIYSCNYL